MNRRARQIVIGAVAIGVAVGGLWMLAGDRTQSEDARTQDRGADSRGAETETSSVDTSVGVVSDAPAKPGDTISNEIAYELVDALKSNGIEPIAGQPLTLEYIDRLDRVRVSGSFESREATSYVLEFDDGAWKVDE